MSRPTWLTAVLITLLCVPVLRAQTKRPQQKTFDFGTIGVEEDWQHTFEFENKGSAALEIKDVNLTPPLVVTKMPARVPPGRLGSVTIRMETPRDNGDFRGAIVVNFKGEASEPLVFWVMGKVVPPIEFDPMPVFFLSTQRGQEKTASIELINHEADPFEIMRVENTSARFAVEAETLEPGRRYRLSLTMKGDGAAGRMADTITVVTSSRAHPFIEVRANTNLNERVHAFPDAIDFGSISTASLKSGSQAAEALSTSLMVYQEEGKDFRIIAETDVPFLRLSVSQADLKDRYEIRLTLVPEKLRSGPVNGTVVILSNDQEFPRMTIPVKAMIEGSW
ncbi:MAG TPA: DUF1573 domain-containing protein [Candidatus Acidoferrum sp.]|nr:DUF1573 domain-containing protein [Candidatus Acidoferrum sp.]